MQKHFLVITLLSIFFLFSNLSCEKDSASSKDDDTVTDIDGNVYNTVTIGDQVWMAENLKVTHFRNGDAISNVTDDSDWENLTSGAYCIYDNNDSNAVTYGFLYNWYAVNDSRNIAPAGWHVPTDEEWKQLEMYLGMSQSEADVTGDRGTNEGSKLKSTSGWNDNSNGTDESSFSASPGGYRYYSGSYYYIGYFAYFWSSTESSRYFAWNRYLNCLSSVVYRYGYYKRSGFSVRCVRG
ncbi:MAG: fibrobacter succinogenes major paralogous domain-containing protein [Candidatus Marinimicrobia bacterium]|nr:fibrobacter succinogenes major paralogous domain-containing protein [Candidatus Neomarinimicrobiota bacterium]